MKLSEAVNTIRDYCSKTECRDCVFNKLYKVDRYNGKVYRCELAGTPYEWGEPTEVIIEAEDDPWDHFTEQVD
jgi:lysozyme family protein